ncbi:MAG: hemerythrin family protein [Desulfofustis sp.]|nr:hemerythrin family protein [Desulfofustis sp.]
MISVFKIRQGDDSGAAAASLPADTAPVDLMPWGPKLSLGIAEIDRQHQQLVALINRLYRAMKQNSGSTIVRDILSELTEYTRSHFSFEEKQFRTFDYDRREEHEQIHRKLVGQIQDLGRQLDAGKAGVTIEVMNFLMEWLQNHIMKVDRQYLPLLKGKKLVK